MMKKSPTMNVPVNKIPTMNVPVNKEPVIANRVTMTQKEMIVHFMENHPNLVYGKYNSKIFQSGEFTNLWKELTNILNSNGGSVTKNPEKWRKTWNDMKRDVKEKMARIEQQKLLAPMNGSEERFTPLQERLLILLTKMEEGTDDEPPPELEYIGPEQVAASRTRIAEEIIGPSPDITSELVIKEEPGIETEELAGQKRCSQQDIINSVKEQNDLATPVAKKPRRPSHVQTSTAFTCTTTDANSTANLNSNRNAYAVIAEHQAATASSLSRLADAAERRLAIEERKAAAMERFVELFFKQQQQTN